PQAQDPCRQSQAMTPRRLHRLLIAPEMIVVDATLALLVALDRALRVEHPLLDDQPDPDDPPRSPPRSRCTPARRPSSTRSPWLPRPRPTHSPPRTPRRPTVLNSP